MFCRSCLDELLIQTCQPFSRSFVGHGMPGWSVSRRVWRSQRCYFLFFFTVSDFFVGVSLVLVRLYPSNAGKSGDIGNVRVVVVGRSDVRPPRASTLLLFDRSRYSKKHFLLFVRVFLLPLCRFPSASCSFPRFIWLPWN